MKIEDWIKGMDLPVILNFHSVDHGVIDWHWKDQVKQFYETWEPKKSDVVITTKLDKAARQEVKDELWESLQKQFSEERKQKRIREISKKQEIHYDEAAKIVDKRYKTGYYKKL